MPIFRPLDHTYHRPSSHGTARIRRRVDDLKVALEPAGLVLSEGDELQRRLRSVGVCQSPDGQEMAYPPSNVAPPKWSHSRRQPPSRWRQERKFRCGQEADLVRAAAETASRSIVQTDARAFAVSSAIQISG